LGKVGFEGFINGWMCGGELEGNLEGEEGKMDEGEGK
jgi:hypothetical protein